MTSPPLKAEDCCRNYQFSDNQITDNLRFCDLPTLKSRLCVDSHLISSCNFYMNCPKCNKKLRGKKVVVDYSSKSFDGVSVEAKEYKCKPCDETFIDYGDDHEINRQICEMLLQNDAISRKHLKYLMNNVFQENMFEFAKRIETTPQHLKALIQLKKIMSDDLKDNIAFELIKKFNAVTIRLEG